MKRELYIDNIRIFLTTLVIIHHLSISYGAPGGWYFQESNPDEFIQLLLTIFVSTNQAFFMGMFFLISAYFFHFSLRKNRTSVLIDKTKRLGIPLTIYSLIITQFLIYTIINFVEGRSWTLKEVLSKANGLYNFGPLWFVAALLIFMFISSALKSKIQITAKSYKFPTNHIILLTAIAIGVISFFVRTIFPIGESVPILNFQLAHFSQYIFMFTIGLIAAKNQWLSKITYKLALKHLIFSQILVIIILPCILMINGIFEENLDKFLGGYTFQSFFFSLWEQLVAFSMIIGLIGLFKYKFNTQNRLLKSASKSAYTVYIIHSIVLLWLAILMKDTEFSSTLKFVILTPLSIVLCFGLGELIRKLPMLKKIL